MRPSDCEIFFSSLRSRSRVRSSSACSSSIVARSAGSGTIDVSSRRCSVVSPALLSRSSFSSCSFSAEELELLLVHVLRFGHRQQLRRRSGRGRPWSSRRWPASGRPCARVGACRVLGCSSVGSEAGAARTGRRIVRSAAAAGPAPARRSTWACRGRACAGRSRSGWQAARPARASAPARRPSRAGGWRGAGLAAGGRLGAARAWRRRGLRGGRLRGAGGAASSPPAARLRRRRAWRGARSSPARFLAAALRARDRLLGGGRLLGLAAALALAGAACLARGFLRGRRARAGAAVFVAVFLTAGFFTGSPRNGGATLARKARREGAAVFDRRGL